MDTSNPLSLAGKVALITGGGSGIGKGTAKAFAAQGCKLGLLGHEEGSLVEVAKELEAEGAEVAVLVADVSKADQMQAAVQKLVDRFGRLDIAFANAGINGVWAPIDEITPEEFDKTMNVNLRGTFLTIKYAVPHIRNQGGGSILVTSSVNGTRTFSNTGATVYSASKAAQVAMTKMLAVELGQDNIRVNCICPGAIKTNIGENTEQRNTEEIKIPVHFPEGSNPLTGRRPGSIDQVGRLALFLVSDLADHINGEVVYIDGGASLVTG